MDHLSTNPVLHLILSHLPVKDLDVANLVCKRINDCIERNRIIMVKRPNRMEINNIKGVITISEWIFRDIAISIPNNIAGRRGVAFMRDNSWQIEISDDIIHVKEKLDKGYSVANFIARRRSENNVSTSPDTIDIFGPMKNSTFETTSNSDGIREVVRMIQERFAPTRLNLSGEPMSADQLRLIFPLLKYFRVHHLNLGLTPISDDNIEMVKLLFFSSIYFQTAQGDSSLMFQLDTGRLHIKSHCNDMNINILEGVLKEWSEGKRDIFQMMVTCPSSSFDADQLEHLLANLENVEYSSKEYDGGMEFSLERDTVDNRDLAVYWHSVGGMLNISN